MSTREERVRLHLWRVHASSFLAVVASQVLLATYLYVYRPEIASVRVQRYIQRHNIHHATQEVTPHTIWCRPDLLMNDPSLRHRHDSPVLREARQIKVEFETSKRVDKLQRIRSKAEETFDNALKK